MPTQPQKNKGGRPRRAAGEKLKKMSISIRQVAFETLELIARQRRTSVSQVIEHLAISAGTETEVDGIKLYTVARALASTDPTPWAILYRIAALPPSLRLPDEVFIAEMISEIGGLDDVEQDEALLLSEIARDTEMVGGQVGFAVDLWKRACKALRAGEDFFSSSDESHGVFHNLGGTFNYDLKAIRIKSALRS